MQHFNNYFVQILVIRPKCQGAKMVQGEGGKKIPLHIAPLLSAPLKL